MCGILVTELLPHVVESFSYFIQLQEIIQLN